MPQNGGETKKMTRCKHRASKYREKQHQHLDNPGEQHRHAREHLMEAVRNNRNATRHARTLTGTFEADLRELLNNHLELAPKQRTLYTDQLATRRDQVKHLSQVLRLLQIAVDQLPHGELAARTHTHYAQQLSEAARRIDAETLKGGPEKIAATR